MTDMTEVTARINQVRGEFEIIETVTENIIAWFIENDNGYRLLNACIAHLEDTGLDVTNET